MELTTFFAPPPGGLALFVARYGADGSLVVSGLYQSSMVFWPGTAFETTLPEGQGTDLFLARYPADGDSSGLRPDR
ncbi:MAG: hypothetical protein ACYS0E_10255 [Planctomycetota bacterium]|jgi:hypothetical protein